MPLVEHLRELRTRMVKAILAVLAGAVVGFIYYEPLFELLIEPLRRELAAQGRPVVLYASGLTQAFTFQLRIAAMAGIVLASPVWLYQLWAFLLPGLHRRERRYTYVFFATAVPLFLAGVWAAYALLPKTFAILLSFTPEQADNLVSLDEYLSFMIRFLLVFGAAFELPVILILLNLVGVLSARKLRSWWRPSVFLIFVFSAVATPTPDPFSMIVLALPMILLFAVAVGVTTLVDRRRSRLSGEPDYDALDDDEISPLDETPSALDDSPSALDDTPSALDDTPSQVDKRPSPIDRPTRIDDLP
jgi:sec-independent protein translocase protein TatC